MALSFWGFIILRIIARTYDTQDKLLPIFEVWSPELTKNEGWVFSLIRGFSLFFGGSIFLRYPIFPTKFGNVKLIAKISFHWWTDELVQIAWLATRDCFGPELYKSCNLWRTHFKAPGSLSDFSEIEERFELEKQKKLTIIISSSYLASSPRSNIRW